MTPPNNYNPFMPFGMNPYMAPTPVPQSQAPKTPQQIEAETRAMNEQYRNAYGMMASMGQMGHAGRNGPKNKSPDMQTKEE